MRIKASCGRLPKPVDLRDRCYKLELTANHTSPQDALFEQELLARIYHELRNGNAGWLLAKIRKLQSKDTTAPKSQGSMPK
jgi:hypothetical protein